jgi:uracil-DNA glycosylase
MPAFVALPHPSWRNNGWIARNPWFSNELLSWLRTRVRSILDQSD